MIVGTGTYQYRVVDGWGCGPHGRPLGIVSAVATDSQDRVYVVDREPHPAIVVFDREGRFLSSWGEKTFKVPHSIWISKDDLIYIADCGTQTVTTCTLDGTVLATLGTPDQVGAPGLPFNQPTWAVLGPSGDLYVSDGYGQSRMHRFSPKGALVVSWGEPGNQVGQFDTPHCVRVDRHERVLVVDRGNSRVQIFDAEGQFLEQWTHLLAANDLFIDDDDIIYLAETEHRISIMTLQGDVLAQWGEKGQAPGQFVDSPHGVWKDSHGDLYICEVPFTPNRLQKFVRV